MSTFVWHDLMTTDADRARAFYGELFDWRFERLPIGPFTAWLIFSGERAIGAIMPEASLPASHWMPYVGVDDLDGACTRVRALGGDVCVAGVEVPPLGRLAVAGDPQGGWFSLLARSNPAPTPPPGLGRFCWSELVTTDPMGAAAFYGALFGWRCEPPDDDLARGARGARVVRTGDRPIAGLGPMLKPGRPAWIPSIAVEDVMVATGRALKLGAAITRTGLLADRTGAAFALRTLPRRGPIAMSRAS